MAVMKVITKNAPDSGYTDKYKDMDSYSSVIRYVLDPAKTEGCVGGWGVNPYFAADEMELVTRLCHKETGVKLRHWVFSFMVDEISALTRQCMCGGPEILRTIAYQLTGCYRGQYQIVFGVHWKDEPCPHIHIVMNTTSYWDGAKFDGNREQYSGYINYARSVLSRFHMSLIVMKDSAETK